MIDRDYDVPDFPSFSDGFENPTYKHIITELIPDDLTVQDIFDLGFLRSNPSKLIYQHSTKPYLFLEEIYGVDYGVRDKVDRRIIIYKKAPLPTISSILYNSLTPTKEAIELIIKQN